MSEALNSACEHIAELQDIIIRKDAELATLREQVRILREALQEARDDVENWAAYADEYFQEKHRLADDLKKYDDIIARVKEMDT